jgi:pullulanase
MQVASQDAYNWGYDPVNWGVPEGSYSTDPDSCARILEYRQMVQVRLGRAHDHVYSMTA